MRTKNPKIFYHQVRARSKERDQRRLLRKLIIHRNHRITRLKTALPESSIKDNQKQTMRFYKNDTEKMRISRNQLIIKV